MKTDFIHKSFALFMAFLMMGSSLGFSMDMHICGNEIKNVSFIGDAAVCEHHNSAKMESTDHACCKAKASKVNNCHGQSQIKGDCCHNKKLIIDSSEGLETVKLTLDQNDQMMRVIAILVPHFNLFTCTTPQVNYTHYFPPILVQNIRVQQQVFRI